MARFGNLSRASPVNACDDEVEGDALEEKHIQPKISILIGQKTDDDLHDRVGDPVLGVVRGHVASEKDDNGRGVKDARFDHDDHHLGQGGAL